MRLRRWPWVSFSMPVVVGVCFLLSTGTAPLCAHEPPRELPAAEVEDAPPLDSADESPGDESADVPALFPADDGQPLADSPFDSAPALEGDKQSGEPAEVPETPTEAADEPIEEPVRTGEHAHADENDEPLLADVPARLTVEAARFSNIQPGTSSLEDVKAALGDPESVQQLDEGLHLLQFSQEPFKRVDVHIADDLVATIIVYLPQRFPADALAQQLELAEFSPVVITDENGAWLGEAYPERGVVFNFPPDADGREVTQVILEPVDANSFVLRAEGQIDHDYHTALSDLDVALQLDPQLAHAHWLRARALADLGRPREALPAGESAVRIDQENPRYRFTLAEILQAAGDFAGASAQTNQGIALAGEQPEWQALGLLQLGNQLAGGPDRQYNRATEHHMRAIKLAEPLAEDPRPQVRRLAHQVLVDAHLAVAQDIAWGHWRQKEKAVTKWLERAIAIAQLGIENGDLDGRYRLRIAREALATYVGMGGALDPEPWVDRLRQVGAEQLHGVTDAHLQNRIRWEVGVALYDTMQTYHQRADHEKALEYGAAAVSYLEAGAAGREATAADAYLLGRLYFRVGSIYSIQHGDHSQALTWFDRAAPLLNQPVPKSALADVGRQGESLVSMAVSYWDQAKYDVAVQLTDRGVQLMEQAVNEGILTSKALAVPYGNLANMHRHLGNDTRADQYIELVGATEPIEE